MGGTYTRQGDYLIPDLALPDEEEYEIGRFGRAHGKISKSTAKQLILHCGLKENSISICMKSMKIVWMLLSGS